VTSGKPSFFAELKRRNVLRAAVLYIGAVWAISQGISQLTPAIGLPAFATRWFLIACVIGFPLWIAFAWFYEFTPHGIQRESAVAEDAPSRHSTARKLDFAIIGVLIVAVVLLASGYFIRRTSPANTVAASAVPAKSIAVLPFENLSDDKNNEYFVAGMQDLILTKLADIGGLKVIARTSTAKYASHPEDLKTIGQQLGVATILEGSVQKQGDEVLINVQLTDTKTDGHIWAEAYTRTLTNVFGVEGDVAEKVATALKAELSPAVSARLASDMRSNNTANDLFLRAEYQANQGHISYDTADWRAAISLYEKAIAKAPDFALAYARRSYVQSLLAWFGGGGMDVKQLNQQARVDAEKALKLAPDAPASRLALGYSDYYGRGDFTSALKIFATVRSLQPSNADALAAQGYIERRLGRFETSIASLKQAFALNPRDSQLAFAVGRSYACLSRYPDAMQWFRRATAIDPNQLSGQAAYAHAIVLSTGDIARALQASQGAAPGLAQARAKWLQLQRRYAAALALVDHVPPDLFVETDVGSKVLAQANLYRLMGDAAHARRLFQQAAKLAQASVSEVQGLFLPFGWMALANAELGLGDVAQGLNAVARALAIANEQGDQESIPTIMAIGATLYAEASRPDLAVPLLTKALATPGIGVSYSPVLLWLDPAWDPIRYDPGFQALLKKYAKYKPAVIPAAPASGASAATSASASTSGNSHG
jgi:TolB-like protein/Tfp pilus assembly protein PilF